MLRSLPYVVRTPQIIVAVLEELGKRRCLTIALSNRDKHTVGPILSFVIKNVARPRFTSVLVGVAHVLLDIYGNTTTASAITTTAVVNNNTNPGQSAKMDNMFGKLKEQVQKECRAQETLLELMGQIDGVAGPVAVATSQED